jgi:hypothetical protein
MEQLAWFPDEQVALTRWVRLRLAALYGSGKHHVAGVRR